MNERTETEIGVHRLIILAYIMLGCRHMYTRGEEGGAVKWSGVWRRVKIQEPL